MSSFLSEPRGRLLAGGLFLALMLASGLAAHVITPILGAAPTPATVSRPLDRAAALLAQAQRPYDRVTFCQGLKAYIPDLVELAKGSAEIDTAEFRPVILCTTRGIDIAKATARAQQDHLGWVRLVGDADLIAFAADEAGYRAAMAAAGSVLATTPVRPYSPLLGGLHSPGGDVPGEIGTLRAVPHPQDGLIVYGPYVDLAPGRYVMRLTARIDAPAGRCREELARLKPAVAATADAGKTVLLQKTSVEAKVSPADPCGVGIEATFTTPAGGAKMVETPLYASTSAPLIIDTYALEPAASAQSR